MSDDIAPDLRQQAGPHVFVEDVENANLSDDDEHHLRRALRLRPGDPLTASDGAGRWRVFNLGSPLEPVGPVVEVAAVAWHVSLAVALTKGSKPELAVQKATELGVDEIVVFGADHSVARWEAAKVDRGLLRLRRVAREAAMQSRQVRVPQVSFVADVSALAAAEYARADFDGMALDTSVRSVAIGPEGGWSERERSLLPVSVDLGNSVLRAETAAIAAATRMISMRSAV